MAFQNVRNAASARMQHPDFRKYTQVFLMSAAAIGAIVHRDSHQQQWDRMTSNESLRAAPFRSDGKPATTIADSAAVPSPGGRRVSIREN